MILKAWEDVGRRELNSKYSVYSSRIEGEKMLARIATNSKVEYAWEYDGQESVWHNFDGLKRIYRRGWGSLMVGIIMNDEACLPRSPASTHYHIHPSKMKMWPRPLVPIDVLNQLPSCEDIQSTVDFTVNGYRDARIVTALGTTTIYAPAIIDKKDVFPLKGFSISHKEIMEQLKSLSKNDTIHWILDRFNRNCDGAITFQFEPINDSSNNRSHTFN